MRIGKTVIFNWFGYIDIGPEVVTALDLAFIIGCRQNNHGQPLGMRIALYFLQNINARHIGQVGDPAG